MARWITDGSIGFTIDGNIVKYYKHEEGGNNVFNCLWEDGNGVSSGSHYWKVHFETLEGRAGVGLTSTDRFKQGYACKAIKYSGNLSDGSCLLVQEFGPSPSAGDVIGILASFEYNRLIVYIDVNGKNLGMAFNIPAEIFKSVYPMVSFHNSGSVTCRKVTDVPTAVSTTLTDIEGFWELAQIQEYQNILTIKVSMPTTTLTKERASTYSWRINASNSLNTSLWKKYGNWKTSGVYCTGEVKPFDENLEQKLTTLMETVKVLKIESNGILSIKSETISSTWVRDYCTPCGYVEYPFYDE